MTKTKLSQIMSSAVAKHLVLKYVKFCQTDLKLMRYCINRKVSNKTNKRNFDKVFKRKLAQYSEFKSDFMQNEQKGKEKERTIPPHLLTRGMHSVLLLYKQGCRIFKYRYFYT